MEGKANMLSSHVKNTNKTQLSIAFEWVKSKLRELIPESGEQVCDQVNKNGLQNQEIAKLITEYCLIIPGLSLWKRLRR